MQLAINVSVVMVVHSWSEEDQEIENKEPNFLIDKRILQGHRHPARVRTIHWDDMQRNRSMSNT